MGNPVTFFEIAGKEGEKLNKFYSTVFGWKIDSNPYGGTYMIEADAGIHGHIFSESEEMGYNNHVTFYIEVDNLQSSLDKAEELGGKTLIPPQVIPGDNGAFAIFLDPSGNYIGLYKQSETINN
ncbi:VOC family protein [Candidatus Poribacteria bacterium]|nr:VOC family protein [Candidatus Poribacteria bacterium]